MKNLINLPLPQNFLKSQIKSYLHDPGYLLPLALTAVGSYGFWISHYSVSIDDLLAHYYYYGELFAQERFTASIIIRLFNLTDNIIWIQDFIGITFLCFAAILLCIFFDCFYKTRNRVPQVLFSCLLVSYPLHATLFAYGGCSIMIGVGLTLTVLALFFVKHLVDTHKIRYLFFACVLLIFVASCYESVLVLYIQAVLAALLLFQIGTKRMKFSELLANGLVYAVPLVAAVVLESLLAKILLIALKIPKSIYHANKILLPDFSSKEAFLVHFQRIVLINYLGTLIRSLFSQPMIIFGSACLVLFVVGLVKSIRAQKNAALFFTCLGFLMINFVPPLLMGTVSPRTCQSFAMTVAFTAYLVYDSVCVKADQAGKLFKRVVLVCLCCLIVGQTAYISGMFTTDDLRYQQERGIITGVGDYLMEHNLNDKPFVFAGQVDFNDSIKSRTCVSRSNKLYQLMLKVPHLGNYCNWLSQNRKDDYAFARLDDFCFSYINHAIYDCDKESVMIQFFRFCGYDDIQYGTRSQQEAAQQYVNKLPAWPHDGSVQDMGDHVIVNLGESKVN